MNSPAPAAGPGPRERLILLTLAALLAGAVLWLRGGLQPQAPLEALARRSPELGVALASGRPTIVEFYADWCEACRSMAPALEAVESRQRERLNVVLLNVDNPRWQPELERYAVDGIPQLELFDAAGVDVGRSLGARSPSELEALITALVEAKPLPQLAGVGAISALNASPEPQAGSGASAGPRSHG